MLIGAVETAYNTVRRLRLAPVKDYSAKSLRAFLTDNVAVGARVETDGWSGYRILPDHTHSLHFIGPMAAHVLPPWIHGLHKPQTVVTGYLPSNQQDRDPTRNMYIGLFWSI